MIDFVNPGFEEASSREWLVSNGIGGYASSTLCGANTRRYHGLLVASMNPPTDRQVLVSKVEETLIWDDGAPIALSANQYPGTVHPEGYRYLSTFERDPLPVAVYAIGDNQLSKTVFMRYKSNTTVVEYANTGKNTLNLKLTPLLVARDYHSLFREDPRFDFYHENPAEGLLQVYARYGSLPLYIRFTEGSFYPQSAWYKNFQYEKEFQRGLGHEEDARSIGYVQLLLEPGQRAFLIFSTDMEALEGDPADWKEAETGRLQALPPAEATRNTFVRDLAVSGDQFLVWRSSTESYTLLAGYHWFTDWGRDTMIAMRGLVVAQGKKETAESIIRTFLRYLDQGMIPNRFPDQGEAPEYNTSDATLWLFVVLYEYYQRFGSEDFIREVFPRLSEILQAHFAGTRYGICATEEGLLLGGEGFVQLTWMDARIGDFVVTPRHGCPVEINALWINALKIYGLFSDLLHQEANPYTEQTQKAEHAFRTWFLNSKGYLNDVVIPGNYCDDTLRPNQIYALSLPFPLLEGDEAQSVLKSIEDHLYTELGLRSLSPDHPDFTPMYAGDIWQRDTAYHQGTVWAFLWGEYALAYLKSKHFSPQACKTIWEKSQALQHHFYHSECLYGISEIFDGGVPGPGKGCVQQAWSVGMMLRVFLDPSWTFDFPKI